MVEDHDQKATVDHKEHIQESPALDALPEIGSLERLLAEKRLVRKLDTRLLPTIFLIFIMNYIDISLLVY
jgi:hypothetical protein